MISYFLKYDLILQNTGSKQEYVVSGLVDSSKNPLYHEFVDFEMPEDAQEGEYMYVLILNLRNDVTYKFKDDLLKTIVESDSGHIELGKIQHEVGVMKYGKFIENKNYRIKNKNYIYRNI